MAGAVEEVPVLFPKVEYKQCRGLVQHEKCSVTVIQNFRPRQSADPKGPAAVDAGTTQYVLPA